MPVIYYNLEQQKSLSREPYKTLTRKFRNVKHALDVKEIEIDIGGDEDGFFNGFYTDSDFTNDAKIKFVFSKNNAGNDTHENSAIFVGLMYSFECNEQNQQFYRNFVELLKKRIPYFYIPKVSHLSFSTQIDDEFVFRFDTLVENENNVLQVCYSLLNQLIAILSFED